MEWKFKYHDCLCFDKVNNKKKKFFFEIKNRISIIFSNTREQQIKSEPCSELELIAIRACAATLCCGIIKDEWFQKTVVPWLDQFMAALEVNVRFKDRDLIF